MNGSKTDKYLKEWQSQEASAERMLPVIGSLYRDKNVVTTVYGRSLVHCTAIDILKAHRFAGIPSTTSCRFRIHGRCWRRSAGWTWPRRASTWAG